MVQTTACPPGWRVSTNNAELVAERNNWDSNDAAGAFDSELKWPVARYHTYNYGSLDGVGSKQSQFFILLV